MTARVPRRRRLLRVLAWLLGAVTALVAMLALVAFLLLGPAPADPALASRPVPAPAIDTAPGAQRPTVILLHGAVLNAHMWDPVIRHLDPAWRVLAIDLPGHGARGDEHYTTAGTARAIADAARRVAPAPVILVGDSLGGYSALIGAGAVPPSQLRGIVLAGASELVPADLGVRGWAERLVFRVLLAVRDHDAVARKALAHYLENPADGQAMLDAGMHFDAMEPAVDALRGGDYLAMVAAVPQPILVVNGDGDLGRVAGEPRFLAAARQGSSYRFRETGHGVSMRRPAAFAALVNVFGARVFAAPTPASASAPAPAAPAATAP